MLKICQLSPKKMLVFHSVKAFVIYGYLFSNFQNSWTLWFFKNDARNKNWEDNQKPITTFHTVEDFWALYNHIELASKLMSGLDYSLFKVGSQRRDIWTFDNNTFNIEIDNRSRNVPVTKNLQQTFGNTLNIKNRTDQGIDLCTTA